MPSAPGWPPVTFRPVRYRRGSQVRGGLIAVVAGIATIVISGKHPKDRADFIGIGIVLIVLGVVFLIGQRGRTTIDGNGLHSSSPFGQHSCRWSDITAIRLDVNDKGEDPVLSTIKIDVHGGRTFTLPVPRDHEHGTHHDNPDFPGQLATIRRYWEANGGPVQP
jgi:hypothetical protein